MKIKLLYLPFLLLIFILNPVAAYDTNWTEKKLGKVILKAEKAAQKKQWSQAIKFGEQMLEGSNALDQHSDHRYINLLKNLNRYYYKAHRLQEIPARIKSAYMLSQKYIGLSHATSLSCRNLYYKLLISDTNYHDAIPLVLENIFAAQTQRPGNFRLLHYREQLSILYGLIGQLEKQESALLQFLELNKRIVGPSDEENIKIILSLAQNYCRQMKIEKFNQLIASHHLKYICE